MVAFLVLAVVVGLVAAIIPAVRVSRINVLRADHVRVIDRWSTMRYGIREWFNCGR
jgi:hypothetical protein